MKLVVLVLVVLVVGLEGNVAKIVCPSSPAKQHAGCKLEAIFVADCDAVRQEISARVNGQATGQWHDPHNNGLYTFINNTETTQWELSRLTGDGQYTDLLIYTFEGYGTGCLLGACSQSQVFSIGDFGTNYCNLHDLYCGDEGCHPFTVLTYYEKMGECTEDDASVCLVD